MNDLEVLVFLINRLAQAQLMNPLERKASQDAINNIAEKLKEKEPKEEEQ